MLADFWMALTNLFDSFWASVLLMVANLFQQLGLGG